MASPDPLERLRAFREAAFACFARRADALFDLADAILTAGLVPSLAHLSLEPGHRRGWGSLYAALAKGRMDAPELRGLVARESLDFGPPVFAIDCTSWARNDAEASPGRGYSYHPSRHSNGKPIVAGWTYSWVARLGPRGSSWTAPLDARRAYQGVDAYRAAGEQVELVLEHLPPNSPAPLFVFDGGYDPSRLAQVVDDNRAAVLVRVRRNRCFYQQAERVYNPKGGRPRRRGHKLRCDRSETWPESEADLAEEHEGYGRVRVRLWKRMHPKPRVDPRPGDTSDRPFVEGALVLLEVARLPRETTEPQAVWLWWRGPGEPDPALLWRAYVRRFDLEHTFRFLKQALGWDRPRVRHPEQADRWTWLVILAFTQLRLARAVAEDERLPWQRPQEQGRLTPSRTRRGFGRLLGRLGSPARGPKPCGRTSPGRPKGKVSGRAPRHPALNITAERKKAPQARESTPRRAGAG